MIFTNIIMKTHTKTLPPALQRVEKAAPLEKPGNFTFSSDQSTEIIKFLNDSVKILDKSNLNLRVRIIFISKQIYNNVSSDNNNQQRDTNDKENSNGNEKIKLTDIYFPIVDKFLNINPPLAPFTEFLKSKELISMLQFITWVILFDIIDKSYKTEALEDTRRIIYNRLSIDFSQLQKKLSNSTLSLSGRFIDLWCSVVCASIFSLVLTPYENTQLYRNSSFSLRIENDVRMLLIGFASPNVKDFHKSILGLMSNELKLAVPTIVTVGGEDYNPTDFTKTLQYEPQIVEAWNQRDSAMFQVSSTTGLMQNAMKLKGAQVTTPAGKIGRSVKKGNVEKSGMPIAKAKIVLLNTEKIVNNYQDDRVNLVNEICATEETYSEAPSVPPTTKLGISFEGFGKKAQNNSFYPHPPVIESSSMSHAPRPTTTTENILISPFEPIMQGQIEDENNDVDNINEKPIYINSRPMTMRASRRSSKNLSTGISSSYQRKINNAQRINKESLNKSVRFKYRKVPDIPEIISTVSNINDYLAANPVFNS